MVPEDSRVILEVDRGGAQVPGRIRDNLAVKAAMLLKARYQVKSGVRLILSKAIPVAGGMAGGSADAAAALVASLASTNPRRLGGNERQRARLLLDELDAGLRDLSDQIQQAHFVTQLPAFSFAVPERSEDAYGH